MEQTTAFKEQQHLSLALLRVLTALSTQHEPIALAQHLVRQVIAQVPGLDGAALWLWSPAAERFKLAAIHTVEGLTVFEPATLDLLALRLHEGHVGKAVASKQPLVFSDATALMHSLWDLDTPNVTALREVVSRIPSSLHVVSLPLLVNDAPVGALDLYSDSETAPFDLTDVSILQLFAEQLAGMFALTQRYSELQTQHQRLRAFDTVVTAINDADDIEQTLEQALDATLEIVGLQNGAIILVNDGLARIEVARNLSLEQAGLSDTWSVDGSPLTEVIEHEEPAVHDLTPDHPWATLADNGVAALALLPLVAGNAVVGVLALGGDVALRQRLDWSVLTPIASQIGIAAAHYQLYTIGQRERRQLSGVIASIAEGVLLFDRTGTVILGNQAALASLGEPADRSGMTLDKITEQFNLRWLDGRSMPPEETPVARALREGRVAHNDEMLVQVNGDDIILSASTAPLLADDGTIDGAVVIFRDVTAQKRHAAVRDEFLAVAAHELRAPLAAIKGYSDLLVKREIQRPDATERDRKGIMMLSAQIDHLVRLVDNLLDVSRIDTGRLELYLQAVDLIALIEVCIDRVSVSNINHNIILNGPPTLEILGDQLRLQQVFTNLLSNAVRYSAPGTDIHVDVWTETSGAGDHDSGSSDGSEPVVVVSVRDQGVGIPPEAQSQVFERYFRANTSLAASGLGLGLYLCREIVARHGGRISLESTPGQGTTFCVELPLNLQRRPGPIINE